MLVWPEHNKMERKPDKIQPIPAPSCLEGVISAVFQACYEFDVVLCVQLTKETSGKVWGCDYSTFVEVSISHEQIKTSNALSRFQISLQKNLLKKFHIY